MEDIDKLRKDIEDIDNKLLELFSQRMEVSKKIGEYKSYYNLPPLDENRWSKLLGTLKEKGKQLNLSEEFIENIWQEIHKHSLRQQK